jgi:hypothetical protein
MLRNKKALSGVTALALLGALALAPGASAVTTLTATQKSQLKYLVEEEKMARDVYSYLSANVTTQKFSNIVKSEQTHMDYVATVLKSYKVWNPTTNRKVGVFYNQEIQGLYNELIKSGSIGVLEAFAAGVTVETVDIASLKELLLKTLPVDVKTMLTTLLNASQNHLAAFSR